MVVADLGRGYTAKSAVLKFNNTLGVNRGPHHLVWSSINTAGVKFNTAVFAVYGRHL